jgi:hypothetical protein
MMLVPPGTATAALAGLAALTAGIFAVSRGTAAAQLIARAANEALEQAFRPLARLPDAFFVDGHFSQIVEKLDAPTVLGGQGGLAAATAALASVVVLGAAAAAIDWRAGGAMLLRRSWTCFRWPS